MLLIGVSDEGEKLIDDIFMQKVGVKYPFVRSPGVNEKYQIQFFPSMYCIDADGQIVSVPADHMPSEQFIEEQLKNVSLVPKMPADSRFDALRGFWEKRDHKHVQDYLDKMLSADQLDAELRAIYEAQRAELKNRADRQLARVAEFGKGPDFGTAQKQLESILRDWKDLEPGNAAQAELARFDKDAGIKKELAASKALDKLVGSTDMSKSSQRRKLVDDLIKFGKKFQGTFAATKAQDMRTQLVQKSD